jgi:hypothetical protein
MSTAATPSLAAGGRNIGLRHLTFPSARLATARWLVIFCFLWPFFNYALINPDSKVEVNFLPVFLAALLLPEVTLQDKWSVLLALPVFVVALVWANPSAPLRLAIGILPLHFVLNLTRHLREHGRELIPQDLSYRALQVFVLFCVVQTVDFNYFHFVPVGITQSLMAILPRYSGAAYDETGIRGVQGWASEPSSAAVMCAAFSLLSILQRPDRRWRVLVLYVLLALVNKSIYSLVLLAMLSIGCLATLQRKRFAFLASVPMVAAAIFITVHSNRIAELQSNLLADGMSRESNRELLRFAQIFYPLQQFPSVYKPPIFFGSMVMEPMGLVPLVVGYGSVFGSIWIGYIICHNFPARQTKMLPLAAVAGIILLMMVAPDLIPAVVTFAAFMSTQRQSAIPCLSKAEG